MEPDFDNLLRKVLDSHDDISTAAELRALWQKPDADDLQIETAGIERCRQSISCLEKAFNRHSPNEHWLTLYQSLFRLLESLISSESNRQRHQFVIVIPVADRPRHLENCLNSLVELCRTFQYGGVQNNRFTKITALIADDSKHTANIEANRAIAEACSNQGVQTLYFGIEQQLELLGQIPQSLLPELKGIFGDIDAHAFYHKGASITRNLTYLKLQRLYQHSEDKRLFYFIDSDQEFRVNPPSQHEEHDCYALNYFYWLDHIFTHTQTNILTGKVVGDPPVSPAVMAGNLLQDIIGFLDAICMNEPEQECSFHASAANATDAAYHDLADLFGFDTPAEAFSYPCPITGRHDHIQCFTHLAQKINGFFDGEHPTRKSFYEYSIRPETITPARTVYTGNFVCRPEGLNYFIPFAPLKLRMAGPVLGRLVKSEINERFVSANLPMLHKRTIEETGQSEFRAGVDHRQALIDLSLEFERQFYGDVMLFSIEKMTASGFPAETVSKALITDIVNTTEKALLPKYLLKQDQIMDNLNRLKALLSDKRKWWNVNRAPEIKQAMTEFNRFIANSEHNFGQDAAGYKTIQAADPRKERLDEIITAIANYSRDRDLWSQTLKPTHTTE